MAIVTMTHREAYEALKAAGATDAEAWEEHNYHGHESTRVSHTWLTGPDGKMLRDESNNWIKCSKHSERTPDMSGVVCDECGGKPMGPLYMHRTHVGLVLDLGEYNGRDDSDFYAIVWNADKGTTECVEYGSTRGWTYPNNAWIDATPEVRAAYDAYCAAAQKRYADEQRAKREKEPQHGKMLTVVKGRKVPVGTVGVCIWRGSSNFGERVGIKDATGTVHWTALGNVEVQLDADGVALTGDPGTHAPRTSSGSSGRSHRRYAR